MQTRDGEHCGDAYALVNFMPSRASRSTFGICTTGMREFSMPSFIGTGVPFHAQSSINSNTMLGFSAAPAARADEIRSRNAIAHKGTKTRSGCFSSERKVISTLLLALCLRASGSIYHYCYNLPEHGHVRRRKRNQITTSFSYAPSSSCCPSIPYCTEVRWP